MPTQPSPFHHCHAHGCLVAVPPRLLMCAKHWRMVPKDVQRLVWKHYCPGQEIKKEVTEAYMLAQRGAVWAVYAAEGYCTWFEVPEVGTPEYMAGPRTPAVHVLNAGGTEL